MATPWIAFKGVTFVKYDYFCYFNIHYIGMAASPTLNMICPSSRILLTYMYDFL